MIFDVIQLMLNLHSNQYKFITKMLDRMRITRKGNSHRNIFVIRDFCFEFVVCNVPRMTFDFYIPSRISNTLVAVSTTPPVFPIPTWPKELSPHAYTCQAPDTHLNKKIVLFYASMSIKRSALRHRDSNYQSQ